MPAGVSCIGRVQPLLSLRAFASRSSRLPAGIHGRRLLALGLSGSTTVQVTRGPAVGSELTVAAPVAGDISASHQGLRVAPDHFRSSVLAPRRHCNTLQRRWSWGALPQASRGSGNALGATDLQAVPRPKLCRLAAARFAGCRLNSLNAPPADGNKTQLELAAEPSNAWMGPHKGHYLWR